MTSMLGKLISLELGMLSFTGDKVKEVVDDLMERGEVSKEEGKKMVDDLISRGEKNKTEIRAEIDRMIAEALSRADVPTRKEIEALKAQIADLRRDLTKEMLEESLTDREGF